MSDKTTETAPQRIWLQVDIDALRSYDTDEVYGSDEEFPGEVEGVTWCSEAIGGLEVEYVRADLVRAAMPMNWRDEPETLALGNALNMAANA